MTKTVQVALPLAEWAAIRFLTKKHKVKVGDYVRAIIVDAIVDEGIDGLQRFRTQGRTTSGEAGEVRRETAS